MFRRAPKSSFRAWAFSARSASLQRTVGGAEDERLSREDTIEDAVTGGDDDRLKELALDELVLNSIVTVDNEELGGGKGQAVESHFRGHHSYIRWADVQGCGRE